MLHRFPAPRVALPPLFQRVSALRGGRALHPNGVAFQTELAVPEFAAPFTHTGLFGTARVVPALLRLSRAVGLPEALPHILGAAVRFPDAYGPGAHQDLLFAAGRSGILGFELLAVPMVSGRAILLGRGTFGTELTGEAERRLRFNPANFGGGMIPSGYLNRIRPESYQASQHERR